MRKMLMRFSFFMIFLVIASQVLAQTSLVYTIEDYSPLAHKMLQDDGESALFKINLKEVDCYLPWKEQIKKASRRFLARRLSPVRPLRKLVRMSIYRKRPISRVSNPKDFFASFHEEVPHTYVVLKNKLIFTESTSFPYKEKYRDKFSKHYLISGLKRTVRYAGEFKVYKNSLNQHVTITFDNASGTFQPASEHLEHLKDLLEYNFSEPGLQFYVRAFDQITQDEFNYTL